MSELETRLGVRVPVYLLFTKADLLAGFTEFFADLDRERRTQVWGATFPLGAGEANPGAAFEAEFRLLVDRLNGQLLDRLQEERGADRRALIAGFPAQVASLAQPLAAFIQAAFGGSRLDRAPFLRGVYLTSGTQEGTPIDQLTASLARTFGLDQQRLPSLRPEKGRSYFLAQAAAPGDLRRGDAGRRAARGGASALLSAPRLRSDRAGGRAQRRGALGRSPGQRSRRDLPRSAKRSTRMNRPPAACRLDPVGDADLPRLVPLLDRARGLPHGADQPDQS